MKLDTLISFLISPYVISVLIATFIAVVVMRRRSTITQDPEEQELFRS